MAMAAKSPELQVRYTPEQIADFWALKDGEKGKPRSARTTHASSSVESSWQRARTRFGKYDKTSRDSKHPDFKVNDNVPIWDLSLEDLEKLAAAWIAEANSKRTRLQENPSSVQRMGRTMKNILVDFHGYLQAFSGIARLMDGLSYGSSSVALDVLSVFMMVALNKVEIEDGLESMIRTLNNEYVRIGRLKTIYTSETMQEHVDKVYYLGIKFSKEATVYYSSTFGRRLLHVFCRPSIDLEVRLSEIKSAISELVEERDTLDRERLNRLETKMDSQIDDNFAEKAAARLEKLTSTLGMPRFNALNELQSYAALIEDTFSRVRKLPPLDSREIFRTPQFTAWEKEPQSFLLVHGQTVAPHNTALSWISQASIDAIRHLQDREATLAWCLCKSNDHDENVALGGNDARLAAPLTITTLGYRLLDTTIAGRFAISACSVSKFDMLQDAARVARDLFVAYNRPEQQTRLMECTQAAVSFLRACISIIAEHSIPEESKGSEVPIYFIVDRFDKLPLRDTALLEPLMNLKRHGEVAVSFKTLVVGERKLRDQKGGDAVADFIDDHEGKLGFSVLEMDQGS